MVVCNTALIPPPHKPPCNEIQSAVVPRSVGGVGAAQIVIPFYRDSACVSLAYQRSRTNTYVAVACASRPHDAYKTDRPSINEISAFSRQTSPVDYRFYYNVANLRGSAEVPKITFHPFWINQSGLS